MSKIIKAINAMISNDQLITGVVQGQHENECFFIYDSKHYWSILRINSGYILNYYPSKPDLESLATIPDIAWDDHGPTSVTYSSIDLATKEATESFRELFLLITEKTYGMDDVLDDIIFSDKPF